MTALANYRSYRDLPMVAGLCTVQEAARPGLGIEECVTRLKRFHYALVRLHQVFTARITAEPIYELKTAFSHHAYLCAEHVQALRTRVGEMRQPPLGLEAIPHPALEVFFDELRAAPTTEELIAGVYAVALRHLDATLEAYLAETHPLTDAPSKRVLRFARLEVADMLAFGGKAIAALAAPESSPWLDYLAGLLALADGDSDVTPERRYSQTPYQYDPIPKRDERFVDTWNQGVNAEAFLYTPEYPAKAKALMMLFKRLREIDVPEMMASILAQTPGKPWGYYLAISRQLWDEARHAMMGEVGFVALGVDWTQARITFNWSYRLNTECTPLERHAVLFFIEQGLMPRTGKRYEFEVGQASGLPLIATLQDFDWADEVLHAQIGRQWLVPELGGLQQTLAYGDECWSRILSNWAAVRDQGLTAHENWWPAIYRQACAASGEVPDPVLLGFATTYQEGRADLKTIAAE
jgi:hypothetical protein